MSKKLTYEEVKHYIEYESKSGYKLLSKVFINSHEKLQMICNQGHLYECNLNNFKNGKRCKKCAGLYVDFDIVNNFVKTKSRSNIKLLSTEYIDIHSPLLFSCQNGHIFESSFHNFKRTPGCPYCDNLHKQYTLEIVTEIFKNNGCKLLSDKYINATNKLKYICSCGNESSINLSNFLNGERCKNCMKERKMINSLINWGTEHPSQNAKIKEKCRETMFKNNTSPVSTQQIYLHSLISGILNYPLKSLSLDIAYPDEKIVVEYNGSGHDLNVKRGNISQEQFDKKEINRNYVLYRSGWKLITISSKKDRFPIEFIILEMIEFAKNYFNENHSYIIFDIDEGIVKTSQYNNKYNYGKLKRITAN